MRLTTKRQEEADHRVPAAIERFYNAHPYPALGRAGMPAYIRMKRALLQSLNIPLSYLAGKTMLEAACGTGESTLAFAYFKPARAVGVDISQEALIQANRLRDELGMKQVDFYHADIQALGDLGGPFDLVMCEVLHQTPDPVLTLQGLVRQTRPGGYLILSVANTWGSLWDVLTYRLVALLAGKNTERRIQLGRRLFFNRFLMWTHCRGLPKKTYLNLDAVIADIYGHPFRCFYGGRDVLRWLEATGLIYYASAPSLGRNGGSRWSRAITQFGMWRSNTFHLVVAARRATDSNDSRLA